MHFKFTKFATALIASGIISLPLVAHANDSSELEELRALVQQLDQKVKILDRKGELAEETAVEKKKATPIVKASEDGFGFESADGRNKIKFKALAQIDYRAFAGAESNSDNTSGFDFRRIRPTIEGTVGGIYDFKFAPEFGENKTGTGTANAGAFKGDSGIVDAYIDARFKPWFQVQAGKFKPSVGLERLQSGSSTKFIERSFVSNAILPNRDLGVSVHGNLFADKLTYAVGVFNGVVDGGDTVTTQDSNSNKEVAGRIFATPFKGQDSFLEGLGFGIAVTHSQGGGKGPTNPNLATGLPDAIKTPGQQAKLITYDTTATATGPKNRFSPQAYYYNGPFGLLTEYALSEFDLVKGTTVANNNRIDAWHVTASWLLTGENASFGAVKPKNAFNPDGAGLGAWEIVGRYQEINIDDKLFDANKKWLSTAQQSKKAQAWALGVNWYLSNNIKIAADYENTSFVGGGTTGADGGTGDRPNEKSLFTRLQIAY
jgi:phosphate-selective porin OprO/OprP